MLISQESLNELNSRLENKVTIRNFRPNFVTNDCFSPFCEVIITLFNSLSRIIYIYIYQKLKYSKIG
jgi:hypothetical protein